MLSMFVFYFLAFLCIAAAVLTVTLANPVTCALGLIVCLVSLAGLFGLLTAGYVAVLQVLVYVGAIMVLFLFVVMLLNLSQEETAEAPLGATGVLKVLGCMAFFTDLYVFARMGIGERSFPELPSAYGTLETFGESLFTRYLVAFEITSILLTAAVVGVVLITRKEKPSGPAAVPPGKSKREAAVQSS